jgi:hypothetical protein
MASKAPKTGDVVKSRVTTESLAGFITATEGIHVWVRFFDTKFEDGDSWDVYTRRDTLEVLSRANSR